MPKPAVTAVNGIAFTLSIELALAAGIVIAAGDARSRQLEIGRGITGRRRLLAAPTTGRSVLDAEPTPER